MNPTHLDPRLTATNLFADRFVFAEIFEFFDKQAHKKANKKYLVYICWNSSYLFFKFNILFQGKEATCKDKIYASKTPQNSVLVCVESENCGNPKLTNTAQSRSPRIVSLRKVRHFAVLVNFGFEQI